MKNKIQTLLKGIFLGSISSLIASHGVKASSYDLNKLTVSNDGQTEVNTKKDNSQKFILKFQNDDSYLLAVHRSHSSHRSHASHASHRSSSTYSGSSSSTSTDYSSPSSTSKSSSTTISTTYNNSRDTKSNSSEIINLGDRILKKGMSGTDVVQLKKILIEKSFLVETPNDESMLFDEAIKDAVIAFQKSIGIVADGIVGAKTVNYLKN